MVQKLHQVGGQPIRFVEFIEVDIDSTIVAKGSNYLDSCDGWRGYTKDIAL